MEKSALGEKSTKSSKKSLTIVVYWWNFGLYRQFFADFFQKNRHLQLLPWSYDSTAPNFPVLIWWSTSSLTWAPSSTFLVLWFDDSQLPRVDLTIQIWFNLGAFIYFLGPLIQRLPTSPHWFDSPNLVWAPMVNFMCFW